MSVPRQIVARGLLLVVAGCSSGGGTVAPGTPGPSAGVVRNEALTSRSIFPPTHPWNVDVSAAPVDTNSQAILDFISGRTPANPTARRALHPDFGPPPYGMPYIVVPGAQPLVPVTFSPYGDQSDPGAPGRPPGYPIPAEARTQSGWIEGGVVGGGPSGDRHLLILDRDRGLLFETWATQWNAGSSRWEAGSGAIFDLASSATRTDGWTSADASGLPILPGLVRADEAFGSGEIRHAFRFTARATNGAVWPATHVAGSTSGAPPMGTRLRLKASVDLSAYAPEVQRIFRAMKSYGLILVDNGTDLYVQGTMDARWNNDVLNPAFASLDADDFEVVTLGWGAPSAQP